MSKLDWIINSLPFSNRSRELLILHISIEIRGERSHITADLSGPEKPSDAERRTWSFPSSELNLPIDLSQECVLKCKLPAQFVEGIVSTLESMNLPDDVPLWINLVSPYGYFGALPWERTIGEIANRPVLRLPDLWLPKLENPDILEAVVVYDPHPKSPLDAAKEQLNSIIDSLLKGVSRTQERVNVFIPAWKYKALAPDVADPRVIFHNPAESAELFEKLRTAPTSQSPWFEWIRSAVKGRSVDSVHFVSRAYVDDVRRGVLLSSSPATALEQDVTLSVFGSTEICEALSGLGAWAAVFSPLPDQVGNPAMALVADAVARARPGSVLFHFARKEEGEAMKALFAFFFSGSALIPPKITDGFIYCQPSSVKAHSAFDPRTVTGAVAEKAAVAVAAAEKRLKTITELGDAAVDVAKDIVASETVKSAIKNAQAIVDVAAKNADQLSKSSNVDWVLAKLSATVPGWTRELKQVPGWSAAAQRYVEEVAVEQLKRGATLSGSGSGMEQSAETARSQAVLDTLSGIQSAIAKNLKS